jgi:hypothetical protein
MVGASQNTGLVLVGLKHCDVQDLVADGSERHRISV